MRLIDADALYEKTAEWEAQALAQTKRYNPIDSRDEWLRWSFVLKERSAFKFDVADAPTIVEFEGDINKVIVKGEEYHKQLTTTWLGNFCPYRCEHCGRYVDSKERYCPNCGRKAVNYD